MLSNMTILVSIKKKQKKRHKNVVKIKANQTNQKIVAY